eukprot:evm.model.NODE_19080_length_7092_cov_19.025805.3
MAIPIQHAKQTCIIANVVSSILSTFALTLSYKGLHLHRQQQDLSSCPPVVLLLGVLPAKAVSLCLFPAVSLGWVALAIYLAQPQLKELEGKVIDNGTFAIIQQQCGTVMHRVNVGRMLCSVFSVLFLWRMSIFYKQLDGTDDGKEEEHFWFGYTRLMTGLGLLAALFNTLLYHRLQVSNRYLKHTLKLRFRRTL